MNEIRKNVKLFLFDSYGVMCIAKNTMALYFAALGYNFEGFHSIGPHAAEAEENLELGYIDEKQFWIEVNKDLYNSVPCKSFMCDVDVKCRIEGMTRIVSDLKNAGYRVAVATNIFAPYWKNNIKNGSYDCFDARYSSCEMHLRKPDPAFYRRIAEEEKISLAEIMLVDDSPENIKSARDCGMLTHLFRSSFHLRRTLEQMGYLS